MSTVPELSHTARTLAALPSDTGTSGAPVSGTGARRNSAIKAAYLWELDTALKAHGIEIPFPQRDLHVRSLFGLSGADALHALHCDAPVAQPAEPASHALEPGERTALATNDARADAEHEMQQDAARAAEAQAQANNPRRN